MIFAKNRQQPKVGYSQESTYRLPRGSYASKLSIFVDRLPNGFKTTSVILQVTESTEQHFEDSDSETGQVLEEGFHSRVFEAPVTAWRFRLDDGGVNPNEPAQIHFTAYG